MSCNGLRNWRGPQLKIKKTSSIQLTLTSKASAVSRVLSQSKALKTNSVSKRPMSECSRRRRAQSSGSSSNQYGVPETRSSWRCSSCSRSIGCSGSGVWVSCCRKSATARCKPRKALKAAAVCCSSQAPAACAASKEGPRSAIASLPNLSAMQFHCACQACTGSSQVRAFPCPGVCLICTIRRSASEKSSLARTHKSAFESGVR